MAKLGVIIANTGSPEAATPEAVKSYLSEFLTDEHIMPMHPLFWKPILNLCILPHRSVVSAKKYASIWTEQGSPLTVTMKSLAQKLEVALCSAGYEAMVLPAASYGKPSITHALSACVDAACDEVVVAPLYPQSAFSTTSVVQDRARFAWGNMSERAVHKSSDCHYEISEMLHLAGSYATNPLYPKAIAHTIQAAGFGEQPDDRLLFAFHSIPRCDIKKGDTYHDQVVATTQAVTDALGLKDDMWALGFQCRFDRSRSWLGPFVSEAIEQLKMARPIGRLFVVAPNFSIDCLETLYDIEIELRERYPDELVYIPCLNDSDDHVALLCDHVLQHISH